jgi:prepilin-type N-terminal cleavage/methylation domain-containing protein
MSIQTKTNSSGFTLMEILVSISLFAFVFSSSAVVYISALRLDSKTRAERAVVQNGRFIMEYLAREIRTGRINYSGINNATHLSLINQANETIHLYWVNNTGDSDDKKLIVEKPSGSVALNSSEVQISNLRFYLAPTVDPYKLSNNSGVQPHVTIVMEIATPDAYTTNRGALINLQSTFAPQKYPVRQ